MIVVAVVCSVTFVIVLLIVLLFILKKRKSNRSVNKVQILGSPRGKSADSHDPKMQSLPNLETDNDPGRFDTKGATLHKDENTERAAIELN